MPLGIFASMRLKRTGAEAIYQSIVIAPPPTALFISNSLIKTSLFLIYIVIITNFSNIFKQLNGTYNNLTNHYLTSKIYL